MSKADRLPAESLLNDYHAPGDFMDVFSASLKGRDDLRTADMRVLADHVLNADIGWMKALLAARDRLAAPFGLKTTESLERAGSGLPLGERTAGDRIGFFRIYDVTGDEIILGEDDWHQDFRLALLRRGGPRPSLFAATCCKRHNLAGYAYLALILPFHRRIAAAVLDTAVAQSMR